MRNKKHKNNIVIASLLAIVLVMGIGYAAFSSKLSINGTGSVSSNWDIKITNMESAPSGGAYNITEPTYEDLSASFSVGLTAPGDEMTYQIEVTNSGNINAVLEKINVTMADNNAIKYDIDGIEEGDSLEKGTSIVFDLTIYFDNNITSMPDNIKSDVNLKLDYSGDNGSSSGGSSGGSGGSSDIDYGTLTKPTITFSIMPAVTTANDNTYPWLEEDGLWTSSTQNKNSTTTNLSFSFTLNETSTLTFDWSVSSESANYDYAYYTIIKDNTTLSDTGTSTKIGGTGYGTTDSSIKYNTVSKELEKGTYTLTFTYRKDGSGNSGTDTAYVKNIKVNDKDLNKLNAWKVNIDYHYDCNTYTCSYQYNNENAKVVKENSSIMVNEEGLMTATVSSGSDKGISKKYVDTTPPTLNGVSLTKTTRGYTITVNAEDKISGIEKYEFQKQGGNLINRKTRNNYTVSVQNISDINVTIKVTDKAGNVKETIYHPVQASASLGLNANNNLVPFTVSGTFNTKTGAEKSYNILNTKGTLFVE